MWRRYLIFLSLRRKGDRMGKYFGTDGFRGEANVTLTSSHAYKIGRFLGHYYSAIAREREHKARARIVIGKDTRLSSYMLEYSLAAGIAASGADVYMLHVITTPGVSYVTRTEGFDAGVMITASHNPYYDNGIKIVDSEGEKLDDGVTALIEDYLDAEGDTAPLATGGEIGRIVDHVSGRNRYVGYLISLAAHSYSGMKIGIDAANGAAFTIAEAVFSALGAEIHSIGNEPSGTNVNLECGSTHIEKLAALVHQSSLDLGFAFDGDADRCIAVDENGEVTDGDKIMYILAKSMKRRGMLDRDTVALTVMSNGGLVKSLERLGITASITRVGDRFVYERMQSEGYSLGGEQSGHVIIKKYATTGDGILTAIMLCEQMREMKSSLGSLAKDIMIYPQHTENVRVRDKRAVMNDSEVIRELRAVEDEIGDDGRVLLRESGTENVIRIMVEYKEKGACVRFATRIAEKIAMGGHVENDKHNNCRSI